MRLSSMGQNEAGVMGGRKFTVTYHYDDGTDVVWEDTKDKEYIRWDYADPEVRPLRTGGSRGPLIVS